MASLRGVEVLQNEIEKAKDKLKSFNENIKKLTGYENAGPRARWMLTGESQDKDDNFAGRMGRGRGRLFGVARRGLTEDNGPPQKRRIVGGAFSRLGPAPQPFRRRDREDSPYEEELPTKLSVQSSVIATSREAKNREEIMQEQTKDKEGMQRNRRMFGLLLGTLNKFKTESKTMESKEEQRKRIDKKLEENAEKEKKKYKQETKQLIEEMHLEQTKISRLEQKMEVVQEHSEREHEMKKLKHFICTKSKPRIFWRPRQLNVVLENKLKDSNKIVDGMLEESHQRLETEIQELMERESKREERIKMRLREDGLFQDEDENEAGEAKNIDKEGRKTIEMRVGEGQALGEIKRTFENTEPVRRTKFELKRRVVVEEVEEEGESGEEDAGKKRDGKDDNNEDDDEEQVVVKEKLGATLRGEQGTKSKNRRRTESDSGSEDEGGKSSQHGAKERQAEKQSRKKKKSRGDSEENDSDDDNDRRSRDRSDRIVVRRGSSRNDDSALKRGLKKEQKSRDSRDEREKDRHRDHGEKRGKHKHRKRGHSDGDDVEGVVVKKEVDDEARKPDISRVVVEVSREEKQQQGKGSEEKESEDRDIEMESDN